MTRRPPRPPLFPATALFRSSSATTTIGAGPFTYDTTSHSGGSGTVTGIGGLSTSATSLTYTGDQINAGTYYLNTQHVNATNHATTYALSFSININPAASATT